MQVVLTHPAHNYPHFIELILRVNIVDIPSVSLTWALGSRGADLDPLGRPLALLSAEAGRGGVAGPGTGQDRSNYLVMTIILFLYVWKS